MNLTHSLITLPLLLVLILPSSGRAADSEYPPLDVMVGAMIMCGFRGAELPPEDPFLKLVANGHVGHVILFDKDVTTGTPRNIISHRQVRQLVQTLKQAAARPMLIAIDQEGGIVSRLKPQYGFVDLPSAADMSEGKPELTRSWARKTGMEMRRLGINVNFAPVADVADRENSVIGRQKRSFSEKPKRVVEHVCAFGDGLWDAHVIPTLKHFPGIGCATDDSHVKRMDIAACYDARRDLLPYVMAFRRGWQGMVMVGHAHTDMDTHPATLSSVVIHDLLRRELGWQGVVISDDMQMRAITDHYTLEQAIALAVNAGTDILLFGNNLSWQPDTAQKVYDTFYRLVLNGTISKERLAASWKRIQALFSLL